MFSFTKEFLRGTLQSTPEGGETRTSPFITFPGGEGEKNSMELYQQLTNEVSDLARAEHGPDFQVKIQRTRVNIAGADDQPPDHRAATAVTFLGLARMASNRVTITGCPQQEDLFVELIGHPMRALTAPPVVGGLAPTPVTTPSAPGRAAAAPAPPSPAVASPAPAPLARSVSNEKKPAINLTPITRMQETHYMALSLPTRSVVPMPRNITPWIKNTLWAHNVDAVMGMRFASCGAVHLVNEGLHVICNMQGCRTNPPTPMRNKSAFDMHTAVDHLNTAHTFPIDAHARNTIFKFNNSHKTRFAVAKQDTNQLHIPDDARLIGCGFPRPENPPDFLLAMDPNDEVFQDDEVDPAFDIVHEQVPETPATPAQGAPPPPPPPPSSVAKRTAEEHDPRGVAKVPAPAAPSAARPVFGRPPPSAPVNAPVQPPTESTSTEYVPEPQPEPFNEGVGDDEAYEG